MDSQSWQLLGAMCIQGSRMSEAQTSEPRTQLLLRRPQLSVSAPSVLDPYVKTRQDPKDNDAPPCKSGRKDLCGNEGLCTPAHSLIPLF